MQKTNSYGQLIKSVGAFAPTAPLFRHPWRGTGQGTKEPVAVREENLQLTQQLSVVNSQLDSEERGADAQARMEEQVLELQQQVEEQETMVANQQQALSAAQEQMNRLQEQLEREREEAELARYRAVAQETSKWEARERRDSTNRHTPILCLCGGFTNLSQRITCSKDKHSLSGLVTILAHCCWSYNESSGFCAAQLDNLQQPPLESHSGLGLGGTSATRRSWTSLSNQVSGLMTFSNCTTSTTPHTSPSLIRPPSVALSTGNMPPLAMLNVPHSSTLTPLYTTPPVSSQFSGHPTNSTRLSPFASTFE